jgi:hypothetical protein
VQYIWTPRDSGGAYLDGGKNYRLHLPPDVPVKVFWSVVVFDSTNRPQPRDGEPLPGRSAYTSTPNADGSVDLYFGPSPPPGNERNWIRTRKGNNWIPYLRCYSPLEDAVEHGWKPGDIVELDD